MNKQTEGMSPEEIEVFNEGKRKAAKAYQERKSQAKEVVNNYLKTDTKVPQEVKDSILYLIGEKKIGGGGRTSGVNEEIKKLLLTGPVTLETIFKKFEIGRPTMNQKIRAFIKADPENRLWVDFHDGVYEVMGQGANPPKNWTGFVPTEKSEL